MTVTTWTPRRQARQERLELPHRELLLPKRDGAVVRVVTIAGAVVGHEHQQLVAGDDPLAGGLEPFPQGRLPGRTQVDPCPSGVDEPGLRSQAIAQAGALEQPEIGGRMSRRSGPRPGSCPSAEKTWMRSGAHASGAQECDHILQMVEVAEEVRCRPVAAVDQKSVKRRRRGLGGDGKRCRGKTAEEGTDSRLAHTTTLRAGAELRHEILRSVCLPDRHAPFVDRHRRQACSAESEREAPCPLCVHRDHDGEGNIRHRRSSIPQFYGARARKDRGVGLEGTLLVACPSTWMSCSRPRAETPASVVWNCPSAQPPATPSPIPSVKPLRGTPRYEAPGGKIPPPPRLPRFPSGRPQAPATGCP